MVRHERKRIAILRRFIVVMVILACLTLLASTWTLTTAQSGETQHTVTPAAHSLTPDLAETATTNYLFSQDALYVTATAFILQATHTVSARQTTEYLLNTDPLHVTATAFVQQATQTVAAQTQITTPTLLPTLTVEEVEILRSRWKSELETVAGFTHPIFGDIVDGIVQSIPYDNLFFVRDFYLQPNVTRTTYEGSTYVAVTTQHTTDYFLGHQFLMFQVADTKVVLLDQTILFNGFILSLGDFADRNDNDYPDISIGGYSYGGCPTFGLALLEIRPGGQVIDITPEAISNMGSSDLDWVDLENDGVLEIEEHRRNVNVPWGTTGCNYLEMTRWYGWNGTTYLNISGELGESYYPDIQSFWEIIAGEDGCLLPDTLMYRMLISYIAMGRLQEGWARLGPLLQWEKCSPETLTQNAEEFGQFLSWIGRELQNELQVQQ